jgi:hypothetical protein
MVTEAIELELDTFFVRVSVPPVPLKVVQAKPTIPASRPRSRIDLMAAPAVKKESRSFRAAVQNLLEKTRRSAQANHQIVGG